MGSPFSQHDCKTSKKSTLGHFNTLILLRYLYNYVGLQKGPLQYLHIIVDDANDDAIDQESLAISKPVSVG